MKHHRHSFASLSCVAPLLLGAVFACAEPSSASHANAVGDKPAKLAAPDDRMTWWRDARFGMFIHWGVYSVPAGEWNGETGHAEWIRETAHIPVGTYEKFRDRFNPVKFDAEQWASLAAEAGMKYLVITSKHHDGFCMFDTKETDWSIMHTPFHRDVLKELSEACARHGVRFCTYHSIMDWHHPDYLPRRGWEDRPVDGADFERFNKYLEAEVTEVITKYHPGVMWFDGEWENTWTHERGLKLFNLCRSLDPKLIINNRVDVHRAGMGGFNQSDEAVGDFSTPEQEIPATGMNGVDWETCMTMNDHWGYNSHDKNFKSTSEILHMLVDIASKGGNYLLNIGPTSEGVFPPESVERLHAIGAWMKQNGESIQGTTASVFDALGFGRCTVKVGEKTSKLYLHVFDWPKSGEIVLSGLGNEVERASMLAQPSRELPASNASGVVHIELPTSAPDAIDSVVVLEVKGKPIVYKAPVIRAAADEFVHELKVELEASSSALELRFTKDGSEPTTKSERYTDAFVLRDSAIVEARVFHDGKAVSGATTRSFVKVTPRAGPTVGATTPGLLVARFDGDWDRVPDWSKLTPAKADATSANVGLNGMHDERVGLRFGGYLEIPKDDLYLFALSSDDGSKLSIDGQVVVDNDGLHSSVEKQASAPLAAGKHAIQVDWFNKTGGVELALRFTELGGTLRAIPDTALSH